MQKAHVRVDGTKLTPPSLPPSLLPPCIIAATLSLFPPSLPPSLHPSLSPSGNDPPPQGLRSRPGGSSGKGSLPEEGLGTTTGKILGTRKRGRKGRRKMEYQASSL